MASAAYRRLLRAKKCTRCRRRAARPGLTKCSLCAKALKVTDSHGARRRRYGASPADIERLLDQQRGRCPICGRPVDDQSALDHAHGQHGPDALRGILCVTPCNPAIRGTDEELMAYAANVSKYAGNRLRVLLHRRCCTAA